MSLPACIDNGRYAQLESERDLLVQALEILGERSFYTKLMYTRQTRGEQVLSLRTAGDIILQTSVNAE